MKRTHLSTWRMIYILIVCCTIILNIFIIVIIGCPILNCMIHYNVCKDKDNPTGLFALNLNAHPGVGRQQRLVLGSH